MHRLSALFLIVALLASGVRVGSRDGGCAAGACDEGCCCVEVVQDNASCCTSAPDPRVRIVAPCPCGSDHGPVSGHVFRLPPLMSVADTARAPLPACRAGRTRPLGIPVTDGSGPEPPPPRA